MKEDDDDDDDDDDNKEEENSNKSRAGAALSDRSASSACEILGSTYSSGQTADMK